MLSNDPTVNTDYPCLIEYVRNNNLPHGLLLEKNFFSMFHTVGLTSKLKKKGLRDLHSHSPLNLRAQQICRNRKNKDLMHQACMMDRPALHVASLLTRCELYYS